MEKKTILENTYTLVESLIVLDFDGVLVRPYTEPEELFPSVLGTLRVLRYFRMPVAVVSSNPRAYHVLKDYLGPDNLITAIRARSTEKWWLGDDGTGVYSDDQHGATNHKGEMVKSIIAELDTVPEFLLVVDDKAEKLQQVLDLFPNWSCKPGTPRPDHPFQLGVGGLLVSPERGLPDTGILMMLPMTLVSAVNTTAS
jgi:hypothetical protein